MAKWEKREVKWERESGKVRETYLKAGVSVTAWERLGQEARSGAWLCEGGFPKFLAIQVIWNLWIWTFEIQDGFDPNPNPNGFKSSKQRIWIWALKSKSLGPNPPHPNKPQLKKKKKSSKYERCISIYILMLLYDFLFIFYLFFIWIFLNIVVFLHIVHWCTLHE